MKKSTGWYHMNKHIGKVFRSSYERTNKSNDRVFVLSHGKTKITFESWQRAKEAGWKRYC